MRCGEEELSLASLLRGVTRSSATLPSHVPSHVTGAPASHTSLASVLRSLPPGPGSCPCAPTGQEACRL